MTPEELEAIAYGVAKIAFFAGTAGAIFVLALLATLRQFTDWFTAREQRHQRITAARARAQALRQSQWLTP